VKIRILVLTIITLLYSITNQVFPQSYTVSSFQGTSAKIKLYYMPYTGILRISCLKDTLYIDDFMTLSNVKVLKKEFLQVAYVERAGSGMDKKRMVLLCVDSGRLFQAMHVLSFYTYEADQDREHYNIDIHLTGENKYAYKLGVVIHDKKSSVSNPKTNNDTYKKFVLNFDAVHKAFYSNHEDISGEWVENPYAEKPAKESVGGIVPVIDFGGVNKYYHINGIWSGRGL
jgi:hypothetical protein